MAQLVKNPPVTRETWVRSLGPEEPLEEGMAAHTSILAWEIPWREEPGGLQSTGRIPGHAFTYSFSRYLLAAYSVQNSVYGTPPCPQRHGELGRQDETSTPSLKKPPRMRLKQ